MYMQGSKYHLEPANENEMRAFLRRFLRTPALLLQVLFLCVCVVCVCVCGPVAARACCCHGMQ